MTTDDPYTTPPTAQPTPPPPLESPPAPYGTAPYAAAPYAATPYAAAPLAPMPFIPNQRPTASANGVGIAAIVLTGAYTALELVGAALAPSTVERTKELLANPGTTRPTGQLGSTALSGLGSMIGIASFVMLAVWMMRIRKNLDAVGAPAGGPPNVEWWGWFVPIANFVLPLLGMRAISRRSVGWGLLLGWWIPFCVVWALWPALFSTTFRAIDISTGELTHPEAFDSMVPLTYATTAAVTVSWLFLVLIIRRTTARHLETVSATA